MLLILLKVKTGHKILETTQPVPHDPLPIQNKWCLWAEMKVHLMPSIMKIAVVIFTAFLHQYPFGQFFFSKPLSKKKKKDQMIGRSPARVLIQDLQDVLVGPTCSGLDER